MLESMHINRVENVGWIGLVPMALVGWAIYRHRDVPEIRRWALIGGVFLLWALGPWLRVAGFDTGVLLPQNFFAYVPVLSNARIPGRAMVVVFIAVALICAHVVALIRPDRQRTALLVLAVLIGIDYLPAPFPVTAVPVPPIYTALRDLSPDSIVCELPVGYRDGFGVVGRFDDQTLLNQTAHRHPIIGGFVARVPPRISEGYQTLPVLRSLFELSGDGAADSRDLALTRLASTDALRQEGIRYLVLNRSRSPASLIDFVESRIELTLLTKDGDRELYEISGDGRSSAPPLR
jgi:hypothetical protein